MSFRLQSKLLVSGLLLVVGCMDGGDAQLSHTTAAVTSLPDLIESTVGDPPGTAVLGGTFTASDTVTNQGTADAGASFTKYYLTNNGVTPLYLLGDRSVGAITASGTDSGSATVTIPNEVPEGAYQLLACADYGPGTGGQVSQVDESDETNNCTASAGSVTISGPDLIESNVTVSPATLDPSTGTLTVSDTVQNIGTGASGTSSTRWYLSTDTVKDASDGFIRNCTDGGPIPGRSVGAISGGGMDAGQASTSPLCVRDAMGLHQPAAGTYYVIACADEAHEVSETNESNNCATSSNTVQIAGGGIDLVESAVSDPPATGGVGTTFPITDIVQNVGSSAAPSSFSKFYLSSNGTSLDAYLNTRAVGALGAGASDMGTTTMTITSGTPMGTYFVVACADAGPGTGGLTSQINETNESNNCTASTGTITIGNSGLPDLVVTAVSSPPQNGVPGDTFNVSDLTANIGAGDAGAFYNKYYLSSSPAPGGIVAYLATGPAAALPAGMNEMVYATATIPSDAATGTYYVISCADSGPGTGGRFSEIPESDENNNCTASPSTINVAPAVGPQPDLVITAISAPPGTGNSGDTFAITDTTANNGGAAAGAFNNKYYLSTNGAPGGIVGFLAVGAAGALAAGSSEMVTATATIPSVSPGTYYLVGCADAGPSNTTSRVSEIAESDENNNCTASATTIAIGGGQPDLVITAISSPPATGMNGDSFAITDTTTNNGSGAAGAFFNKYYLSTNGAPGGIVAYLATGSATALPGGTSEMVTATATLSGVGPGTYWLVGCADAGPGSSGRSSQIPESNEENNCTTSATQITIN